MAESGAGRPDLLAIEGAFLLVGDVSRRLGAKARPYAVFPFVCDPAQPTTAGEVGMLKGEFWAPLWDGPATLAEVRHLFRRGLARVGSRSALLGRLSTKYRAFRCPV